MRTSTIPLASTEDQTAIFGGWSSFLNYFDTSLPFQLFLYQPPISFPEQVQGQYPPGQDDFNSVRAEFTGMLEKTRLPKSNNGIERSKYITFGVPPRTVRRSGRPPDR